MSKQPILVIEDEPLLRESLRELLQMEGYDVWTAEHGQAALEVLERIPRPCLILLDLMMPVMNGWEFLERLYGLGLPRPIPVAVVSAGANLGDLQQRYGCCVIAKPIDIGRLLQTAREHCGCVA